MESWEEHYSQLSGNQVWDGYIYIRQLDYNYSLFVNL